ncbi:NAD(P)H-binding protein [Salinimonas lutimaris]|uniref:NAD(P)H-binding protein n=1 Tax=Salinimonas lutimaris TaxID=914153 RepID=UPI0010BF974A|nr:NAD(P)H-binding protein [Salinimonas lutimaris]
MTTTHSVAFLGATGAVGSAAMQRLVQMNRVTSVLSVGRRKTPVADGVSHVKQVIADVHNSHTYAELIHGYRTAICTLGVGQPSTMSKAEFVKTDKEAVLAFARVCKAHGVSHFQLLASVGISKDARNFYLRTKGELIDELIALDFARLSIFQPSMILTPNNRYGLLQGLTLRVWPKLDVLLRGELRKYRGIPVDVLGRAIANNTLTVGTGVEYLVYDDFWRLSE